jgi:NADPH-dependent 2,4-dienoyl-CoA reductase/sulfur reductase-like enzyme
MRVVIVGAGPAGISVAERLRDLDHDADITLLSAEPFPPYAPPAMADHFLSGRDETLFWKGRSIGDDLRLDYRSGTRVASLWPDRSLVALEDGGSLSYDRLVIASGSRLYAPLPGFDLPGVCNFKSLTAARSLVEQARTREIESALIVGAGFIGVEVALMLSDLGLRVILLEERDRVMPRMLDAETAEIVLAELRARGVDVRLDTRAAAFRGSKRVTAVELAGGEVILADVHVAATGVQPVVDYLDGSEIDVGWGVVVDDRLRTTVRHVYAAGDVAETRDRMTGERYVHAIFPNAVAQGNVVAENLAGYDSVYEGAESMNSLKHMGVPVMAVGAQTGDEELRVRRGDLLRKIFLSDGRIVGFRLAGDIRGAGTLRSLMLRRTPVGQFGWRLLDPRFSVGDLVLRVPTVAA